MRLLPVLCLLALTGCGGLSAYNVVSDSESDGRPQGTDGGDDVVSDTESGSDDDPTDSDSEDPTLEDIDIDDVDPNFGTNGGGTQVTLTGGPFDASARVTFDGEEADIVSVTASKIVVETPSTSETGWVKVKVVTDTGSGAVNTGFQYWEDGEGLTGALGSVAWTNYVGDYWSSPPVDEGDAGFAFIEPTNVHMWQLYSSAKDTCQSEYESGLSYDFYNPDASSVQLKASSATITLYDEDSSGYFEADDSDGDGYSDLSSSEYRASTNYALEDVSGGSDWPSFGVPAFVSTPGSFQVSNPRLDASAPPYISQNSFNIEWTGSGGDYMLAVLYRFNGSSIVEVVTCVMNDDGAFKVPSSVWNGWTTGQQMTILVARATESSATLDHNNSNSGVVGEYWIFGAAFTQ